jgi:hypothetical protein
MGIFFEIAKLHNNFLTAGNELSTPHPENMVTIGTTNVLKFKGFIPNRSLGFN